MIRTLGASPSQLIGGEALLPSDPFQPMAGGPISGGNTSASDQVLLVTHRRSYFAPGFVQQLPTFRAQTKASVAGGELHGVPSHAPHFPHFVGDRPFCLQLAAPSLMPPPDRQMQDVTGAMDAMGVNAGNPRQAGKGKGRSKASGINDKDDNKGWVWPEKRRINQHFRRT